LTSSDPDIWLLKLKIGKQVPPALGIIYANNAAF